MNRHHFLTGFAASLVTTTTGLSFAALPASQPLVIPLWTGTPPGGGGPHGNTMISSSGAQSNIAIPTLTILTPAVPNGHSVLIAGGGGYKRIQIGKESWPAARWLAARGYTAAILSYRLPGEGWRDHNLVSLQDAQRALRILRQREKRVSVLGFSAGGHLMGMAATRPGFRSYPVTDPLDELPATADSAALIYPVITLEKPYTHTSAHKLLVGAGASAAANAAWSVQNYVTPHSPPFFLVQAENDPLSDPHNTLMMSASCEQNGVPVAMHRYATGGHGFGMGKAGTPTAVWPEQYEKWLHQYA
ncbi:alpha/beta hydrolase [Erwinia sp. V71]|uniref:alpha/beta hydrolase n=1 Tax=Erwinia sp. V71 TaxID=3369424 RepID=UPI003F5EEF69